MAENPLVLPDRTWNPFEPGTPHLSPASLKEPLDWPAARVAVETEHDLFGGHYCLRQIAALFGAMGVAGHCTFVIPTRHQDRAQRVLDYLSEDAVIGAICTIDAYTTWAGSRKRTEQRHRAIGDAMRAQGRDPDAPRWPFPGIEIVTAERRLRLVPTGDSAEVARG